MRGLGGRLALVARRLARRKLAGPVDTRIWGLRLRLLSRGSVSESRILFVPDAWDRIERAALERWLEPDAAFVDVGANAGAYSFWALSRMGPRGRVVAVEPNPDLALRLRYNVRVNGAEDRMRVVEAAVGARRAAAALIVPAGNSGEGRLDDRSEPGSRAADEEAVAVSVVTLADVAREAGLDRIDCLKVDVEGREADVILPYLEETPRERWPRCLVVEMESDRRRRASSRTESDLERRLVDHGYALACRSKLNGVFELAARRRTGSASRGIEASEGSSTGGDARSAPAGRGAR